MWSGAVRGDWDRSEDSVLRRLTVSPDIHLNPLENMATSNFPQVRAASDHTAYALTRESQYTERTDQVNGRTDALRFHRDVPDSL